MRKVKGDAKTVVSVLVEYREGFDASIRWEQTSEGLLISAVNGHRLYTNNKWPNPVVLKIENALPVDDSSSNAIKKSTIDGAQ